MSENEKRHGYLRFKQAGGVRTYCLIWSTEEKTEEVKFYTSTHEYCDGEFSDRSYSEAEIIRTIEVGNQVQLDWDGLATPKTPEFARAFCNQLEHAANYVDELNAKEK